MTNTPKQIYRLALKVTATAALLLVGAGAQSAFAAIRQQTCPDGSVVNVPPGICPEKKNDAAVTQPGVTGSAITGTGQTVGGTIGGVLGGSFGGGGGAFAGFAPGVQRTALVERSTGAAAAAGGARWNAWFAYSQSNIGYSFQPLQMGGTVGVALGGVDYRLNDSLIIGVAVSDERTRVDTAFNGGKLSGNGSTVAPYLGWRINQNWLLDASIGAGNTSLSFSDNSAAGSVTGSNKDKRTIISTGLGYNHAMGQWLITGKGSVLSVEDKLSSFTLSNNTFVNATTTRTTQARVMAQAAYNAGSFVPFLGITYINDLERPNQNPVGGQSAANDRDGWLLRAGINFRSAGALYGGVQVSSEAGRSQVKNEQILFNVGLRF